MRQKLNPCGYSDQIVVVKISLNFEILSKALFCVPKVKILELVQIQNLRCNLTYICKPRARISGKVETA